MKKLLLLILTTTIAIFGIKIIKVLSEIRNDVKRIRIVKVGNL